MKSASTRCLIVLIVILGFSFTTKGQPKIIYDYHNNVFLWGCTEIGNQEGIFTYILGIENGNGIYTISTDPAISVSATSVDSNTIFEIFVPQGTDIDDIEFEITDSQNNDISIDEDIQALLAYAANTGIEDCLAPPQCTSANITLNQNDSVYPDTYQAINTITASSTLPDKNTIFIASQSVTLTAGFSTIDKTNFEIRIESCN